MRTPSQRADWERRKLVNDESRSRAEHHREPWSHEETDFLMQWDQTTEELILTAELLGRTTEACSQRFYEIKAGRPINYRQTRVTVTTTTRHEVVVHEEIVINHRPACPACGLEMAATGECGNC